MSRPITAPRADARLSIRVPEPLVERVETASTNSSECSVNKESFSLIHSRSGLCVTSPHTCLDCANI